MSTYGLKRSFLVGVLVVFFLFSCSNEKGNKNSADSGDKNYRVIEGDDGIKTYLNKSRGSDENLQMDFKEILTIKGDSKDSNSSFSNISRMCVSQDGDIYLFDKGSFTIKKFNKKGKLIRTIGSRGTGPGEFTNEPSLAVLADTLYVTAANANKVLLYDNQGEFVRNINFDRKAPQFLFSTKNNTFVALDLIPEVTGGTIALKSVIAIYDSKFKLLKVLKSLKIDFNPTNPSLNPMDFIQIFAASEDGICVADINENEYRINIYDLIGKHKFNIGKAFKKVKMSNEEAKKMSKQVSVSDGEGNVTKNNMKAYYKKAINAISVDKYGRVWVNSAIEYKDGQKTEGVDLYFDIFSKDGVYLKTYKPDFYKSSNNFSLMISFQFVGDYLYIIDGKDKDGEENMSVRVFDY